MRVFWALILAMVMVVPGWAQDQETPWRATVDGQIEALQAGDGETALSFAGVAFRANFQSDPQKFVAAIAGSGYGPIVTSRSHSFGEFRELAPGLVAQAVNFIDADGRVWEAVYQLVDERDEGWRVQGVVLRSTGGLGI